MYSDTSFSCDLNKSKFLTLPETLSNWMLIFFASFWLHPVKIWDSPCIPISLRLQIVRLLLYCWMILTYRLADSFVIAFSDWQQLLSKSWAMKVNYCWANCWFIIVISWFYWMCQLELVYRHFGNLSCSDTFSNFSSVCSLYMWAQVTAYSRLFTAESGGTCPCTERIYIILFIWMLFGDAIYFDFTASIRN